MSGTTGRDGPGQPEVRRNAWAESFAPVLEGLRDQIRMRQPAHLVAASGAEWKTEPDEFRLNLLTVPYRITWPDLVVYPAESDQPCRSDLQGLFLYYLDRADGMPCQGRWIAFRELPDGWLYHQAFQGYTGQVLALALGNDIQRLHRAAASLNGRRQEMGDAAYAFTALPMVPLAVVYWLGDEEYAPHAQVLFDAVAGHFLPTDGLALLGSRLVRGLLSAA